MIALVGYGGGSRAMSVGPFTLVDEHLGALLAAGLAAGVVAFLVAFRVLSPSGLVPALLGLVVLDLFGAVLAVSVVGELQMPMAPQAFVVITGLGTQLLAAVMGGAAGILAHRIQMS